MLELRSHAAKARVANGRVTRKRHSNGRSRRPIGKISTAAADSSIQFQRRDAQNEIIVVVFDLHQSIACRFEQSSRQRRRRRQQRHVSNIITVNSSIKEIN